MARREREIAQLHSPENTGIPPSLCRAGTLAQLTTSMGWLFVRLAHARLPEPSMHVASMSASVKTTAALLAEEVVEVLLLAQSARRMPCCQELLLPWLLTLVVRLAVAQVVTAEMAISSHRPAPFRLSKLV